MKNCSRIQRLIDEAERPDVLSYEVDAHLSGCAACSQFANERARLRALIASTGRVAAPDNFDALLRARIREHSSRRTPAWLSLSGMVRWGMGAAAAAALIIAAQVGGLFGGETAPVATPANGPIATAPTMSPIPVSPATTARTPVNETVVIESPALASPIVGAAAGGQMRVQMRGTIRRVRGGQEVRVRVEPAPPALLVANDEIEVPVPTVTRGAQPLVYSNVGRPAVGLMKTSF